MNQHKNYKRWAKESYVELALQNVTEFPGGAALTLRKPNGSSVFATQIFIGYHLVVTGDGPDLIFRGGPSGWMARLHWLANSSEDYLRMKLVAADHGDAGLGWTWDRDIAIEELKEYAQEYEVDLEEYDLGEYCHFADTYHGFREQVSRLPDGWELDFGRSPALDIYFAKAAAAKALEGLCP